MPDQGTESLEALTGKPTVQDEGETTLDRAAALAAKKGKLRVYLGAAPGVGKTYAMLSEAQRRRSRGADVVIGYVQTYGRPLTEEMTVGLERVPTRTQAYRGTDFEELDPAAVIARAPEMALIDELAHTNIPGSRRAKRWEDVVDILAERIDVITTLNVQHFASLNDVVASITGIRQQETVPDWILDLADQVELVDMSPYALRRRLVHGNVYPDQQKAELALRRFFTEKNLTALRELALMKVANQVDDELLDRFAQDAPPDTRERVLVCVSKPEESDGLIRRGARIARRAKGDLLVVHVRTGHDPFDEGWEHRTSTLVAELGGTFDVLREEDAVDGVLGYAYRQQVTQIVVGESKRSRVRELLKGSFVGSLIRRAADVDIHVFSSKKA